MTDRPPAAAVPVRLDRHLVQTGAARSRGDARRLITAGAVLVDGQVVRRASYAVTPGTRVDATVTGPCWVGRGAVKLDHALSLWEPDGLSVRGRRCLDVGASTGGFTQVLLRRGVAHVHALDVGHGQLAPQLVADDRVSDLSGTHVRDARPDLLGGEVDLVVADLSFIPLSRVVATLATLCRADGDLVLLVKPQFEVGPDRVGRGGIVRDPAARELAVRAVLDATYAAGLAVRSLTPSPIPGGTGNLEYLMWAAPARPGMMGPEAARVLGVALTEKERR